MMITFTEFTDGTKRLSKKIALILENYLKKRYNLSVQRIGACMRRRFDLIAALPCAFA